MVLLRGFGLGGWLVPESFMIQFPQSAAGYDGKPSNKAPPNGMKDAIKAKIGEANAATFWAEYTKNYVTKDDLLTIKSWGFNSLQNSFQRQRAAAARQATRCVVALRVRRSGIQTAR